MLNSSWQIDIYKDDDKVVLPKYSSSYHLTTKMDLSFIKLQPILESCTLYKYTFYIRLKTFITVQCKIP